MLKIYDRTELVNSFSLLLYHVILQAVDNKINLTATVGKTLSPQVNKVTSHWQFNTTRAM